MAFPTTAPGGGPLVTGTLTLINGVNYIYDATSVTWSPVSTTNSLTLGSLSVNSLTSLSSLDVQGSETVSGNITAQGLISGSNTNYTYGLPTVGATADWIKVGRFTAPQTLTQKGSHCYVKIVTSTGISAVTGQQTEIHIRFSTSNSVAVDANGFGGFTQYYVTNTNTSAYAVKVVSNSAGVSATYYDMWYYQPGIENGFGSFYTVEINESVSNWDHVGITATALNVAAPGAASNTIGDGVNLLALQSNLGIGVTPTAKLHIAAGTTTVAPIKLTSGTSLTTPVNGSMEYDGTSLYFTPSAATRKAIAYADGTNITFPTNGTVTTVSVASANGFAGTVSNSSTTPAITISTSITGILKGNATAVSAATAGTDYSAGTSSLTTGILKSTTTTGALSIATAGTDYQAPLPSQTGNSGKYLTTDGSALSWATVTAGGSMVYPGSGIANSTGSAWGTSYSVSGTGNVVLTTSPTFTTSIDSDATFGAFASSTTLTLGYNSTLASTTNISTGAVAASTIKTINIGTGGAASSTTNVNIGAIAGTLTLGAATITATNATSLALNGTSPALTTTSTGTGYVFNTNIATGNLFGSASTAALANAAAILNIGNTVTGSQTVNFVSSSTGTQTINIGGGATTIGVTKTINIGGNATTAATTNINIGSNTSTAIGTTTIYSNTKISKIAVSTFTGALNNGHLTFTDSYTTAGSFSSIDYNTTTVTAPYAKISSLINTRNEGNITSGVKGGEIRFGTNNIYNFQVTVTGATFASNVMTLTYANTGVALWSTGGTITVAGLTPAATSGTVVNVNGVFTVLTCTTTQVTYTLTSAGTYTWTSGGTITGFYGGATGVNGAWAAGDGINNIVLIDSRGYLAIGTGQGYPSFPLSIINTNAANTISFVSNNTTTAYNFGAIANTTGTLYFGVETSAGGGLFTGSAAYSTIVGNRSATSMHLVTNSAIAQTINSSGYITKPLQPSFMARSAYTAGSGPSTPLPGIYIFATVDHNISASYNATSGVFTAPVAGKYVFHAACNGRSGLPMFFQLRKNSTAFVYAEDSRGGGGYGQAHADVIINLAANDTVDVYISYAAYGSLNDYFCGYLLG